MEDSFLVCDVQEGKRERMTLERESERERSSRETHSNPNPWIPVRRRRPQPSTHPNLATKTIFIDFLPINTTPYDISNIFFPYGLITDIVLPEKLRPNTKHRYPFVRFYSSHSMHQSIKAENGRKVGNFTMKVNPAKTDKPSKNPKPRPSYTQKNTKTQNRSVPLSVNPPPTSSLRDARTYKEVSSSPFHAKTPNHSPEQIQPSPTSNLDTSKPPEILHPHPDQIPEITTFLQPVEPQPDYIVREMSQHRIMNSRILGADTEATRDEVEIGLVNDEHVPIIKGEKNSLKEDLLQRSLIGFASSSLSSSDILDCILAEGVNCMEINPMGGMMHLITFETTEDKEAHLESQWLKTWFLELRNPNDSSAALWRKTTISIYGVPLSARSHGNFYKIGCIYGRVLSVDYSGFDYAQVMIYTDCLFKINNPLLFDLGEKRFNIFVFEDPLPKPIHTHPKWQPSKELSGKDTEKSPNNGGQKDTEQRVPITKTPLIQGDKGGTKTIPENEAPHPTLSSPKKSPRENTISSNKENLNHCLSPIIQNSIHEKIPINFSPSHLIGERSLSNSPSFDSHKVSRPLFSKNLFPQPSPIAEIPDQDTFPSNLPESPPPKANPKSLLPSLNEHDSHIYLPNDSPIPSRKSKSNSTTSSLSEIPFPPGFESAIPTPQRKKHEKRRLKKIEKIQKKSKKSKIEERNSPDPSIHHMSHKHLLGASDIIELGVQLGLQFNGPITQLHSRIEDILARQQADWAATQHT